MIFLFVVLCAIMLSAACISWRPSSELFEIIAYGNCFFNDIIIVSSYDIILVLPRFRFTRVLPLPTPESLESSESWWCHCSHGHVMTQDDDILHSDDLSSDSESSNSFDMHSKFAKHQINACEEGLTVSFNDCYVDNDSRILFSVERMRVGAWSIGKNGMVLCTRCRGEVGRLRNRGTVI